MRRARSRARAIPLLLTGALSSRRPLQNTSFESEWVSPWMNSEGCTGNPDTGGSVIAVTDGFFEITGDGATVMSDYSSYTTGAGTPIAIDATESFTVTMEVMPDAVAPVTTDTDFGIYICKDTTHTTWNVAFEADCFKFWFDETAGTWNKNYATDTFVLQTPGTCDVPAFAKLQVVYTPDTVTFTDDAGCAAYSFTNPWGIAGYDGDVYVYMAFSESNYLWAAVLSFVAVSGESADLTAGTNSRVAALVPNPTTCPERMTIWIWYGAGCANPVAFAGEIGPAQNDGTCVGAGDFAGQPVWYTISCDPTDNQKASMCMGVGLSTDDEGAGYACSGIEYAALGGCALLSADEWTSGSCVDSALGISMTWTGQCNPPSPTAVPTLSPTFSSSFSVTATIGLSGLSCAECAFYGAADATRKSVSLRARSPPPVSTQMGMTKKAC